jgi:hypothetical protein
MCLSDGNLHAAHQPLHHIHTVSSQQVRVGDTDYKETQLKRQNQKQGRLAQDAAAWSLES